MTDRCQTGRSQRPGTGCTQEQLKLDEASLGGRQGERGGWPGGEAGGGGEERSTFSPLQEQFQSLDHTTAIIKEAWLTFNKSNYP